MVEHQSVSDLRENPVETIYFLNSFAAEIGFFTGVTWTARTEGDPTALVPALEAIMRDLDPGIPLVNVEPLNTNVLESTAELRFSSTLIALFGLLALMLAVIGLYGVLAWRIRQRMQEIGVRLAFGSTNSRIFKLVLGQGMTLVAIGLGAGILLALVLTRGLQGQLIGIGASDPLTYLMIGGLFALIAAAACMLPALRAVRVDPSETLRTE